MMLLARVGGVARKKCDVPPTAPKVPALGTKFSMPPPLWLSLTLAAVTFSTLVWVLLL